MANLIVNNLPYFIQGDSVSTTATINLGFIPISATFVEALITGTGVNVTSNVSNVSVVGQIATITFVAGFSYIVTIILDILPALPLLSGSVQVTNPWIMTGQGAAGTPDNKVITVQGISGATPVPVSGTLTGGTVIATQSSGSNLHVDVDNAVDIIGTVDVNNSVVVTQSSGDSLHVTASLGNTAKTKVMKTGTLVTTAVTADQAVLTYTVTSAKTFYVQYLSLSATQTTLPGNGNPVALGTISLESPIGTKLFTTFLVSPANVQATITLAEPMPITSATVIRVVTTPAAVTSFTWYANFGGYEK
jgi:hypothetical protein